MEIQSTATRPKNEKQLGFTVDWFAKSGTSNGLRASKHSISYFVCFSSEFYNYLNVNIG